LLLLLDVTKVVEGDERREPEDLLLMMMPRMEVVLGGGRGGGESSPVDEGDNDPNEEIPNFILETGARGGRGRACSE
jgi:hypothetical protein